MIPDIITGFCTYFKFNTKYNIFKGSYLALGFWMGKEWHTYNII